MMRVLDLDGHEVHSRVKGGDGLDGARLTGAPN
jgi:hypothetical protein